MILGHFYFVLFVPADRPLDSRGGVIWEYYNVAKLAVPIMNSIGVAGPLLQKIIDLTVAMIKLSLFFYIVGCLRLEAAEEEKNDVGALYRVWEKIDESECRTAESGFKLA